MLEQRILEELFRQNYSKMIHLARVLLGDDEEAEDVVQDIFLLTAVRNACLNKIRQKKLHERVKALMPIDDEADLQPIDKQLERFDNIAAYVNEQLEEPHRSIFHFRFDEDLTIHEIARRLGLNPNTTYKYLMQSIQQIKNHFSKL